jgi:hypothetical protein
MSPSPPLLVLEGYAQHAESHARQMLETREEYKKMKVKK